MRDLNETELKVFVDAVLNYFQATTPEPARVRAAYLADGELPHNPYTGLITVAGHYRGCVHFSAPAALLRELLLACRETDRSEAMLLDAVGEIANTIAGNARRHFGAGLEISVPVTLKDAAGNIRAAVRARPFVICLRWRVHEAVVVVDLAPAD